jgi:hypothetical protein
MATFTPGGFVSDYTQQTGAQQDVATKQAANKEAARQEKLGSDSYRQEEIRLIARDSGFTSGGQHGVRFFVTPELNESRTVNYQEISELRQAGGLLIYIGTQARTYQLTARMVSRTQEEADMTYINTHTLKSWTVPTKSKQSSGFDTENTPMVLKLYGYGASKQIRGVPVVITSLSIDYPSTVSYIKSSGGAWIPILQTFSIALKEARNADELTRGFNLQQYKEGTLPNW